MNGVKKVFFSVFFNSFNFTKTNETKSVVSLLHSFVPFLPSFSPSHSFHPHSNDLDVPQALVDKLDLPREQGRGVCDRHGLAGPRFVGERQIEALLEREEEVDEGLLQLCRGGL